MKTTIAPQADAVRPLKPELPDVEPGTLYSCRHCLNEYSSDESLEVCQQIVKMDRDRDALRALSKSVSESRCFRNDLTPEMVEKIAVWRAAIEMGAEKGGAS